MTPSLVTDELIAAINEDIRQASEALDAEDARAHTSHALFTSQ